VLFLVAVVISFGVVYAVRNINITYEKYSEAGATNREYTLVETALMGYKGKNILTVNEADVANLVNGTTDDDGGLVRLVSFEKVMPCTLNIVIKERIETFAYEQGERFNIYDEDGILLSENALTNLNKIDECPNVLVTGDVPDSTVTAEVCLWFKKDFGNIRALVKQIHFEQSSVTVNNTVTFELYSGLKIVIFEWQTATQDKIYLCAEKYFSLTDSQKITGSIRCQQVQSSASSYSAMYIA
jgi:hypothetical protein